MPMEINNATANFTKNMSKSANRGRGRSYNPRGRGRGKSSNNSAPGNNGRPICQICGKQGHITSNCCIEWMKPFKVL